MSIQRPHGHVGDARQPAAHVGRISGAPISAEYPPRVRLEWLIATARVLLAAGALVALAFETPPSPQHGLIVYALSIYLVYALAMLAIVWTPLRFARGWALVQLLTDLAVFSLITLLTRGALAMYFVFLMISGTLRWQLRGALVTGVASMAAYAAVNLYSARVFQTQFEIDTFIVRSVHMGVVAVLLGYIGIYNQRFQREIGDLASWPRRLPDETGQLVEEVLRQSASICGVGRAVLLWEEPAEGHLNVAWAEGAEVNWSHEPEGTYGSIVAHRLQRASFQTSNAAQERARVTYRSNGSFRVLECRPVNEALRARFAMRAVQSWPLDGELVRGRLFCLDKRRLRIDDLIVGDLVARLAVSRLESLYLLRDLRDAAARDERIRVARDLHDSVLQSLAGAALQLMAARRVIERDPSAAAGQLEEVQKQIESGELEMRSFIRRLRPDVPGVLDVSRTGLKERLEDVCRRLERQWDVKVNLRLDAAHEKWPATLRNEIFQLAREGLLNAARHADPSAIELDVSGNGGHVNLRISDDGRGFPFRGRYDLATLNAQNRGPWSLRERVGALGGTLQLTSTEAGSELSIVVPLDA